MRRIPVFLLYAGVVFTGSAFGQAMTEFGAAAAGSSIGAAGGKGLSSGINSIFGKVGQQLGGAAKADTPAMVVAPGTPTEANGGVPAPVSPIVTQPASRTPIRREADPSTAAVDIPFSVGILTDALPAQAPAPPPTMSLDELKRVEAGMSREALLHLGEPSSKITMYDGGHLVESYSYRANGQRFGGVKLSDGVVSSVQAQ